MQVFENVIKVFLLESIRQEQALNVIASYIDKALSKEDKWKKLHTSNQYKNYCFSSLFPIEKSGTYKKETIYQIRIRTTDEELATYLQKELASMDNQWMKGLVSTSRKVSKKLITRLYSITPVIVKGEQNRYWRDDLSFEDFEQRLKINLIKKYILLTGEVVEDEFPLYHLLELTNQKPIAVPYKSVKLLADKVELQISDHPMAQKLAYMALGTGLCEANARGFGFLNYKYI